MTIRTPADKIVNVKVKNGSVRGILRFNRDFGARKTAAFQLAQKYVDSEVLRLSDPLTPRMNGDLIRFGILATDIGSGIVQYNSPYARYQYYGKVMVGSAPKQLTNIPLNYNEAPRRGAKWFERVKAKHREQILKGAGKIVGK